MRIRSAALGTTTLLVLLTAGAAQSLTGSNTVYSDDIVNEQVKSADIATNAVTSTKVYPNTLTGSDINEATLGTVPSAASLGGLSVKPIVDDITAGNQVIEWGRSNSTITVECTSGPTPYIYFRRGADAGTPMMSIASLPMVGGQANGGPETLQLAHDDITGGGQGAWARVETYGASADRQIIDLTVVEDPAHNNCHVEGTITKLP